MTASDFVAARADWLSHIASMVNTVAIPIPPAETGLTQVELALVNLHVGISHILGADQSEASLSEYCEPPTTVRIVSSWRSGGQSTAVSGELVGYWLALWYVGCWAGLVRQPLSDQIAGSFLSSRLGASAPSSDPLLAVWQSLVPEPRREPSAENGFDCSGSHLELIRGLSEWPEALTEALLPLERLALVGGRGDALLETSIFEALRVVEMDKVVENGWGGPRPSDVPPWLRDYAIAQGGRILQDRAGVIPCLFLIAETVDELRAISGWRYGERAVGVGSSKSDPNVLFLQIEVDFDDGGPTGKYNFRYNSNSSDSAASLSMLSWVEMARLEVYSVASGQLEFAFAHGVRLTGIREPTSDPERRRFPEVDWFQGAIPDSSGVLTRMRNAERVQFELVRRGEEARKKAVEPATSSYLEYLHAVDDAARSACAGIEPDRDRVDRARRQLHGDQSLSGEGEYEIALEVLGVGRGLLQVQWISDEPQRVMGAVAFKDASGSDHASLHALAVHDYESGGMIEDEDGLAELTSLPLNNLVLSPSGPHFARPLHEDFLAAGFHQVTYAHRSTVISDEAPRSGSTQDLLLAGWAGTTGPTSLTFLPAELAALERLYGAERSALDLRGLLPSVVHLAGHGMAGRAAFDHWLQASPSIDRLVTPANVLLDVDASQTDLVYLSSCSSGRGEFDSRTVMETLSLDVAFLERGARCVLSTSAPVNDAVAAAFAIAFHVTWRSGASIWEAYQDARITAANSPTSQLVSDTLVHFWPTWTEDLGEASAAHPDDWTLFRISGRHW